MTIINNHIDLYTAFIEREQRLLENSHVDREPRHKFLIKKYSEVLEALQELRSALHFENSTE